MPRPHPQLLRLAVGDDDIGPIIEPSAFVDSAIDHRVDGVVSTAVRAGIVTLPDRDVARLAERDLVRRTRQQQIWTVLETVANAADEVGVSLAQIKGVVFQQRWYRRDGERDCVDLDCLIAPESTAGLGTLVQRLQPDHALGAHADDLVARGHLQAISLDVDGVPVDLHVDLLKLGIPSRLGTEIWSRTMPFELPTGRATTVLPPEVELLHLLCHLNKDRFRQLQGLVDVDHLVESGLAPWGEVVRLADIDGLRVPVVESRRAVDAELGRRHRTPAASGPRAWLWRRLWSSRVRLQGRSGIWRHRHRQAWIPITMQGRLGDTLRWWIRKPFPDPILSGYRNPGPGGYLRRLARGRIHRVAKRREDSRSAAEAGG